MADQVPFGTNDFAENPEPRCPCILLLDTSGSMKGKPIEELNAGLITYKDELVTDLLAAKRVEVGIVTFGPVRVLQDFTTAEQFIPPHLQASGDTPMGEAINRAIEVLASRKETYRSNGITYYRPWIFMITDGAPTDAWEAAAARVKEGEKARKFQFFCVGVEGADFHILKQISLREPLKLDSLRFHDLFHWLSSSHKSVSRSGADEVVPLENPMAPDGWARAG